MSGLAELELWLHDLLAGGLEAARNKPRSFWTTMADRLVDARAGDLALELRTWLSYVKKPAADWHEQLLGKMGEMQLLIEGFKRLDTLPTDVQHDLKARVGWRSKDSLLPPVGDSWTVLGRNREGVGGRRLERVWLWGNTLNRAALIVSTVTAQQKRDTTFLTGIGIEADLRFYPGSVPLRAELASEVRYAAASTAPTERSFKIALADIAQKRTLNPWLTLAPLVLRAVSAEQIDGRWHLRDAEGYVLPLPPKFNHGWHLAALSRGGNLTLFGEWNGETFTPLSVYTLGIFLDLRVLKGSK